MRERKPLVLVVDDEAANIKLLVTLLEIREYATVFASHGKSALQIAAEQQPDLILLDLMMPDMDGFQVIEALKQDSGTADIPIIMVTSIDDTHTRQSALDSGAEDFIVKPVDRTELWTRVRNSLKMKQYREILSRHGLLPEA